MQDSPCVDHPQFCHFLPVLVVQPCPAAITSQALKQEAVAGRWSSQVIPGPALISATASQSSYQPLFTPRGLPAPAYSQSNEPALSTI